MKLTSEVLKIDPNLTENRVTNFIRNYIVGANVSGIVIGISGGIDSATCAATCAKAIGGAGVLGLNMPEAETRDEADIKDAQLLAEMFGIRLETIDISPIVKAVLENISLFDSKDRLANGNVKARVRMIVLYYYANRTRRLVVSSSDKSETMLGYFTKWGDYCADISPLADLYKSQVRQLALHLGLPTRLVQKPPTPGLWPGQTAEAELGLSYDQLDLILYGLEHFMKAEEIARELGLSAAVVKQVEGRWLGSEHKRRQPLCVKLGYRSVGHDFRLPYQI